MGSASDTETVASDTKTVAPDRPDPWPEVFTVVNKSDERMFVMRKQDLDSQYHVAVFFSSCLAMVVLDSYKWLTDYASLSIIARCLATSPSGPPPSGPPPSVPLHDLFMPYNVAVFINALWFLSLVLTVASLLASYVCSHYLREFRNLPQFDPKHALAFRQMRYRFLRRWNIFGICDIIHMILPSAMLLAFGGLVLLFNTLDRPESCIVTISFGFVILCFVLLGLCPFLFSLLRWNTRGTSPFPSPISWSLFKLGHLLLSFSYSIADLLTSRRDKATRKPFINLLFPSPKQKSIHDVSQLAHISGDWLEQDCSSFLDPSNADAINVLLADALLWIERKSTIEKSAEIKRAIYACILDLDLNLLKLSVHSKPEIWSDEDRVGRGGLATVFYVIKEWELSADDAHELAKRWLEGVMVNGPGEV